MTRSKIVILLLSLFVFTGAITYMGLYFYKDMQMESDVSALRKVVKEKKEPIESETPEEEQKSKYADNGMLSVYYDLYTQNNDMVGWVKIPDTKVDYPVMYHNGSNEFYLHRNFEKEYSESGLPYLDYQCSLEKPSTNLIIYGHNMRSGAMFSAITKYKSKDFYEKHPNIMFDTLYAEGEYEIFSVFTTVVGSKNEFHYTEYTELETPERFNEFIRLVKDNSLYDTGKTANFGDRLLSLSTCSYDSRNERTVIIARKIR